MEGGGELGVLCETMLGAERGLQVGRMCVGSVGCAGDLLEVGLVDSNPRWDRPGRVRMVARIYCECEIQWRTDLLALRPRKCVL